MRIALTITTRNVELLQLVHDFGTGMGWTAGTSTDNTLELHQPDSGDEGQLLHLLTYAALGAVRTSRDPGEPQYVIRYRRDKASQVTLGVRITDVDLGT